MRRIEGIAYGSKPGKLSHEQRNQDHRERGQRERTRGRAPRHLAPGRQRQIRVARDEHFERQAGYGLHRAETLDAVDRTYRSHRPGPSIVTRRQHRLEQRIGPPERHLDWGITRNQCPIPVHERNLGSRVETDVAIELMKVVDPAARADRAGELAGRRFEATHQGKHPWFIARAAYHRAYE